MASPGNGAMTTADWNCAILQSYLAVRRRPVILLSIILFAAGALAWLWYVPQAKVEHAIETRYSTRTTIAQEAKTRVDTLVAPSTAEQNLAGFYDAIGEQRNAEQQIKTLFAIAAKNGLTLSSGQYKAAYDQNMQVHTYQLSLPMKGNYHAVWQFCRQSLAAIRFAALDDISFHRDTIMSATVDANVRFTLYLKNETVRP
jgi:Tfp pilus assembly protein PilO